jgi:hypothetical protein
LRDATLKFDLIFRLEFVFAYTANGAYPIIGDILKSCSWLNTTVRVTYCGVIDITANFTNVLHNYECLVINDSCYSFNNPLRRNVIKACIVATFAGLIAKNAAWAAVHI